MKTLSILSVLAAVAVTTLQAAPAISVSDISEESLRKSASDRQRASLDAYHAARKKAEKAREDAETEARDITARNDAGMKKTILRRHLNTMLPPCDREPEAPRDPRDYTIRD